MRTSLALIIGLAIGLSYVGVGFAEDEVALPVVVAEPATAAQPEEGVPDMQELTARMGECRRELGRAQLALRERQHVLQRENETCAAIAREISELNQQLKAKEAALLEELKKDAGYTELGKAAAKGEADLDAARKDLYGLAGKRAREKNAAQE